jgi:hypothetical protein
MRAETLKIEIIDRLMKVHNTGTLERMNELIIQAEMEANARESLESIEKGDVLTLDEMREENIKWAKKNNLR